MLGCKKWLKPVYFIVILFTITVMLVFPDVCKSGVSRGMLICSNVIIPSLFPIMVCILIIMKLNIMSKSRLFSVMLFSILGGYPMGCKLINELYVQNKINKSSANIMQMYCVNAGPAFIISAVGNGVLGSSKIGMVLFASHITATFIIAVIASAFGFKAKQICNIPLKNDKSFSEIFVTATADASKSTLSICSFIIVFSVINSYIAYFFESYPTLKLVTYFTEVSFGVTQTKNIPFISFLLGFSGISIWFQLISISKDVKLNLKYFMFGRILHGTISSAITVIILKLFNITVSAFSNNRFITSKLFYNSISISISLAIMIILWIISLYTEKNSSKLLDNMI